MGRVGTHAGQPRFSALGLRPVELHHVAHQHKHAPAVEQHVVGMEGEGVALLRHARQANATHRRPVQGDRQGREQID